MNRATIPGYYFDEAKGKYFKIQDYSSAANSGQHRYSTNTIQGERRETKRRKLVEKRKRIIASQTVQRSMLITSNAVVSSNLVRELGIHATLAGRRLNRAKAFAAGLDLYTVSFRFSDYHQHSSGFQEPSSDYRRHSDEVANWFPLTLIGLPGAAEYDLKLDRVFTGRTRFHGDGGLFCEQSIDTFPADKSFETRIMPDDIFQLASEISSINISASRHLIATTFGAEDRSEATIVDLAPKDDGQPYARIKTQHFGDSVFCSAANQFANTSNDARPTFAVGVGKTVELVSAVSHGRELTMAYPADIFSMGFISGNTIACGSGDGIMRLWDTRGATTSFSVNRLQHKEMISSLRVVDDNRLAIHGERSGPPALYDLRMTRAQASTPVVEYIGANDRQNNRGFDVHAPLGLAVHSSWQGIVRLYSLWTGKLLREIPLGTDGQTRFIKFVDGPAGLSVIGSHSHMEFKLQLGRHGGEWCERR